LRQFSNRGWGFQRSLLMPYVVTTLNRSFIFIKLAIT
jgi:hypothetical protein